MKLIITDDPIIKQEQLDDINASSFTPKAFKSSKTANSGRQETNSVSSSVKVEGNYNDLCNNGLNDQHTISNKAGEFSIKRKNETVFHDSVSILLIMKTCNCLKTIVGINFYYLLYLIHYYLIFLSSRLLSKTVNKKFRIGLESYTFCDKNIFTVIQTGIRKILEN